MRISLVLKKKKVAVWYFFFFRLKSTCSLKAFLTVLFSLYFQTRVHAWNVCVQYTALLK
ncbi:hypothetical protein BD560DRAFT_410563 [Blakeslea trispora]|nr:hypothetical protein BD560DRAFT_410563 [Blakeslea trispora]